ncbi:MAG: HAD family hydrolase [Gemmatimonadales bacterium]
MLIDFGGTLDADGEPWVDRFFHGYCAAGGSVDRLTFGAVFARSDAELARTPGIAGFDYSATVQSQAALLANLLPDGTCLRGGAVAAEFVASARVIAERNRGALEALAGRFRLAVVSNYQGNLRPCLDELALGDLFDVVSDSALVGTRKPDRRIFDLTLAALGCSPGASWMIGDSPPNDIAPAAALGLRTCWLAAPDRETTAPAPTTRTARFDRVPELLAT